VKKAGLVIAGTLMLAGCGQKLDTGKIESDVKQELAGRTGAKVVSVDCPGDVEAKRGNTFSCTARTAAGEQVPIEVIQEDGQGKVRWRVVRPGPSTRGL
jgi:Domain of unknown function (DUF4333)/Prokaryotic lipoprotein-attachment site